MVSGAAHEKKEVSPSVRGWQLIVLGLLSPIVVVLIFGVVVGDPKSPGAEAAGYLFGFAGLLLSLVLVVTGLVVLLMNHLSSGAGRSPGEGRQDYGQGRDVGKSPPPEPTPSSGKLELPTTETSAHRAFGLVIAALVAAFLLLSTFAGLNFPSGLWVAIAVLGVFVLVRSIRGMG